MNILITGATGFIGRKLTQSLVAEGHSVAALTRDVGKARSSTSRVRFYEWRIEEKPPAEAIADADVVINLAGETVEGRWTGAKKRQILDSRVIGTRNLVSALAEAGGTKALVSASAVGYYGDRGDEELTEDSRPGTGFLMEVTRAWEVEALKAKDAGARVAVLRLGIVMGREGGALKKMLPLFNFGIGGPLGSGKQWWPWVHVDDVVRGLASAAISDWEGVYNLTAPQPVRQADFARALGAAMHRPAFAPVPAFVLRIVQGEFADEVLFSKRVLPRRLQQAGFSFVYPEVRAAMEQLVSARGAGADLPARA